MEAADVPLLLLTLAVPLTPTQADGLAYRIIVLEVLAFAALLLMPLGRSGLRLGMRSPAAPLDRFFVPWLAVAFLGLVTAHNLGNTAYKVGYLLALAVLYYGFTTRIRTFSKALAFLILATIAAITVSLLELALNFWGLLSEPGAGESRSPAGSTLFMHTYLAAQYLLPVLVMILAMAINRGPRRVRIAALVAALPILVYLVVIGSRGAYLAALVSLGVVLMLSAFRVSGKRGMTGLGKALWSAMPVIILLSAAIFLLAGAGFLGDAGERAMERVSSLFDREKADFNFSRFQVWTDALIMSLENPLLGVGQGNFAMLFPTFHLAPRDIAHAHNQFLHILGENGLLGLICFLLVLVSLFGLMRRRARNPDGDDMGFALQAGSTGALFAAGVYCFFETPLEWPASAAFCLLPISILLVPSQGEEEAAKPSKARPPWFALAGAALILWIGPGVGLANAVRAGKFNYDGHMLLRAGSMEEAIGAFSAAESAWPWLPEIYLGQAWALFGRGRFEEALGAAERYRDFKPGSVNILSIYGECLKKLGRHKEAADCIKTAMYKTRPANLKAAYYLLGKAYRKAGSPEAALLVLDDIYMAQARGIPKDELRFELVRILISLRRDPNRILSLLEELWKICRSDLGALKDINKLVEIFEKQLEPSGSLLRPLKKLKNRLERDMKSLEES